MRTVRQQRRDLNLALERVNQKRLALAKAVIESRSAMSRQLAMFDLDEELYWLKQNRTRRER